MTILRARVLDLAERVSVACREQLASFCGADAVGELPALPEDGEAPELPPLPEVEDRAAMERWGRLVAAEQRESGLAEGRELGLEEGVRKVAVAMLARGMAREVVAETTGLSVEETAALESGLAAGSVGESDREFRPG
ncbi:hypothetical protein JCM17961_44570 [Endothiovibrio diazotrophicus]